LKRPAFTHRDTTAVLDHARFDVASLFEGAVPVRPVRGWNPRQPILLHHQDSSWLPHNGSIATNTCELILGAKLLLETLARCLALQTWQACAQNRDADNSEN
jgi:hypothetical protein